MRAVGKNCNNEVLQAIIDHGADVNATGRAGTALMIACTRRYADAIYLLLEAGADPNIADDSGVTCLMRAVGEDCSKEVLQAIIDHGADVNSTSKENGTALIIACVKSYTDAINVLLKAGANPNIVSDDSGATCLMHAVEEDCSKEVLQAIIDHGADVNTTNKQNCTALIKACEKNYIGAINVLLEAGAGTNRADINFKTCLVCAVDSNCSNEVLQAIIDHGADVNATSKETSTALMIACEKSYKDAINVLLKAGADPNFALDDSSVTCFMCAVLKDCSNDVLQAMIDRGADVNATNKQNCTALMVACTKRYMDAIYLLLKAGANPNIADDCGVTCLMRAVGEDCSNEVLQAIIEHGADVNATNKQNCTALMIACTKRYIDAIYLLLKSGANPNIADDCGVTCLMRAVGEDCSNEVLQAIIDHGADVNSISKETGTALMIACARRYINAINLLLEAGASPNIALDDSGVTCLMFAVGEDCNNEALRAMVNYGADVNTTGRGNHTALIKACKNGYTDAINLLLEAGADPNIADDSGVTCLMFAVGEDCSNEVLQAIIDHGADVNNASNDNCTALMLACAKRHADAINVLLKAGANPNITDDSGATCLMCAVGKDCSKEVLQAIIDYGADVNATSKENFSALMIACGEGYTDNINMLMEAGANPNIADDSGATCLMCAVGEDCSNEVLQAIVDHGADVNATNKQNCTALMISCTKRNIDAIYLLLKAGANPNIADDSGVTCLMRAVGEDCSNEVLQAIIDHGADVNYTSKENGTALMIACAKSYTDAINVLLKARADPNMASDESGATCLMRAVGEDCSKEVLQAIIDHGADVNTTNKQNCTALTKACEKNYIDAINVLLEAGADTLRADNNCKTCLMCAVDGNCSNEVLQAIIDHGADVNAKNIQNYTALMVACLKGNVHAINVLVKTGSDINTADIDGNTCLMHAVRGHCSKEVLQAIIDHGVDVNATNKENHTALMSACQYDDVDAITVLLGSGADPNIANDNGDTCFHIVVIKSFSKKVIQTIIDHGVNVDATNNLNMTPLMVASKKGNVDAMNVLLNARADPNITSVDGSTWLHAALEGDCSKEALQVIIEHETNVNATNKLGITPLELASENRNTDAIMLLLYAGANLSLYLYPKGRKMVNWYKLRAVLHWHKKDVRSVCPAYFPRGSFVSVSKDIAARLWVPNKHDASFMEGHLMSGQNNFVTSVCMMPPDEKYPHGLIVTGSSDHTILAYTLDSPQPIYKLEGRTNDVCSLAAGRFGTLLSASWDKTAKVWLNQKCVMTLVGHEAAVWAVVIISERGYMPTGSADKLIQLWRAGKCQQTYAGHTDCVRAVAVLSASEFLSASNDTTIRRWLTTGECIHTYNGHTGFVCSLALLPNGEDFVSGSEDRTLRVWSNGQCVQIIAHPTESVWTVCALENGDIVTGASDGVVRLFTTAPERAAEDTLQKAYEDEVAASFMPSQIGDLNTDKLSGPETLLSAGKLDGQTMTSDVTIWRGNKVEAHQWTAAEGCWVKIGDTTRGESGEGTSAEGDKKPYGGKEYDYVFDVGLDEGKPLLKLPFNNDDDPWMAAQNFLQNNKSPVFLNQVTKFITE